MCTSLQAPTRVPIEPLAGPLRDPRVCTVEYQAYLLSREYLVASDWAARNVGPPVSAKRLRWKGGGGEREGGCGHTGSLLIVRHIGCLRLSATYFKVLPLLHKSPALHRAEEGVLLRRGCELLAKVGD